MKTPFDKTFCTYLLATKNTGSVRIFYEFVNYLMPIREHSVSVLWKIWYIFRPIIYSYTLFFLIFLPLPTRQQHPRVLLFIFWYGVHHKKYTLNLSSKNISQYCKSPFLLCSCVYNRNGPHLYSPTISSGPDIIWYCRCNRKS